MLLNLHSSLSKVAVNPRPSMNIDKEILSKKLIERNCFWSYKMRQDTPIPDDILIEKTLIYLDLDDINKLFKLFPNRKIKQVWRNRLVIQGDYYRSLNKLLAWLYFDIKNPDKYIKTAVSQHVNKLK
ncbi:MAG: hypothetical protein Q8N05_00750 [Bacteroidota bacterium]|nr:hypothetical protein [Bacteroidota bacterium]